ncbi:Protein GrpE [Buchnera aphidicola (Cinara laricifoliae)]|uniref:Protein GrpE n=1 Tax=Buchnera aphidicola (Cinara laricifoliae) TaxID=2518977 RepID=A0A451DB70_9GAMM|nr:Protein GrpE [Buchnera aphidicola (Cinara laricifoliae)]
MKTEKKNIINKTLSTDSEQKKIISNIDKTKKKIIKLIKEKKNIKLRYYADIDNFIKQNEKEIKLIQNDKFKNFLKSITPIIDKIDYLVKISINSNSIQNTIIEGIQLTFNLFEKNLKTWNISRINKTNIPFNPEIHILAKNNQITDSTNNKIVKKIKKNGYIFKKEVIQKAIVTI